MTDEIKKMKDECDGEYVLRLGSLYGKKVNEYNKKFDELKKLANEINEVDKTIQFLVDISTVISKSQVKFSDGSVLATDGKTVWLDSCLIKRKGNSNE